jgi:hypothetical protein
MSLLDFYLFGLPLCIIAAPVLGYCALAFRHSRRPKPSSDRMAVGE